MHLTLFSSRTFLLNCQYSLFQFWLFKPGREVRWEGRESRREKGERELQRTKESKERQKKKEDSQRTVMLLKLSGEREAWSPGKEMEQSMPLWGRVNQKGIRLSILFCNCSERSLSWLKQQCQSLKQVISLFLTEGLFRASDRGKQRGSESSLWITSDWAGYHKACLEETPELKYRRFEFGKD